MRSIVFNTNDLRKSVTFVGQAPLQAKLRQKTTIGSSTEYDFQLAEGSRVLAQPQRLGDVIKILHP